jgi:hypothetical protein
MAYRITDLAAHWRSAHDIRKTVADLSDHPDLVSGGVQSFEKWRSHALEVADQLDPMKRSLFEVIQISGPFFPEI